MFTPGRLYLAQFEIHNIACFVYHKVHLWSTLCPKKVRKRWTEKTKVRTWSGKSGLFTDLAFHPDARVPRSLLHI
jgi:hypothetical protein